MPRHANLPTRYSCSWFPGDIISDPFYDLTSHETNSGELESQILEYEFEHIKKKVWMYVIMISFSQPGFMGSKMQ
jgi:hypothetical protein